MAVPKHSYLVMSEGHASHSVFVKYDKLPAWLQHIATFRDKDRADSYAEIENSCADDEYYPGGPDIALPKDLPEEAPPSALPRVYGTTMPATKTVDHPPADRHDTVPPDNSSVGQAGRPDSSGMPDARPAEFPEVLSAEEDPDPVGTFVDQLFAEQTPAPVTVATLHPVDDAPRPDTSGAVAPPQPVLDEEPESDLTPAVLAVPLGAREGRVLAAIRAMTAAGTKITYATVGERVGFSAPLISTALKGLVARGLVAVMKAGDPGVVMTDLNQRGGIRLLSVSDGALDVPVADHVDRRGGNNNLAAETDANIRRRLLAGESLRAVAAWEKVSINTVQLRRDALVAEGLLTTRADDPTIRGPRGSAMPPAGRTVKFKDEVTLSSQRRFTEHAALEPELVKGLGADHPAVVEGRTIFPSTVVDAAASPHLLVSGHNSRKTGDRVTKGAWRGMPIFTLTLEERATCPTSCELWTKCYGNAMPFARRHRHGDEFERLLELEIAALSQEHPGGFVVRLHILGDFYSVEYLAAWDIWLGRYPALHAFGYTAHQPGTEMGDIIAFMRDSRWDRFAIRTSAQDTSLPTGARTIFRKPETASIAEGIVCPAQTDRTDCCGTCGLCWAAPAKDKTIVFIAHGKIGKAPNLPAAATPPTPPIAEALTAASASAVAKPGLKVGPLPPAPGSFNKQGPFGHRKRDPMPPGTKVEKPDEFLARGGAITKVPPGHASGTIDHGVGPVTVRPKHGY